MKPIVLPSGAAWLRMNADPVRGKVLTLNVLRSLHGQLTAQLQPQAKPESGSDTPVSPVPGAFTHTLPPFEPQYLDELEAAFAASAPSPSSSSTYAWLVHPHLWRQFRTSRPKALVLGDSGRDVFRFGHRIRFVAGSGSRQRGESPVSPFSSAQIANPVPFFHLLNQLTHLMRHSPIPIVAPLDGLVAGAGCQLALAADHAIALADTPFQLTGPPSTYPAVAAMLHHLGVPQTLAYRMMTLGEPVTAEQLGNGSSSVVDSVPVPQHAESTDTRGAALTTRVLDVVAKLAIARGQMQALSKWAYWTGVAMHRGDGNGDGDGYAAASWMARVVTLLEKVDEAAARPAKEV
ncbi:hypothetical protein BD289DRAFT_448541 [Coniella lustricola]|uniref:ClpP/crotonase-like domain-containing protein n=1 Tax=Coniella lustricola TaxID=2025994 RepID=A0A2T2ZS43_9PEZI|nr:hypothetical protein BD289DRAFT_448541 [Coniella lustricola]